MAADELNVTPAAISHQIKALEDHLGVMLFIRRPRALILTEAGQGCLPDLRAGFDQMEAAVNLARRWNATKPLTISVVPTFGARWLVPRIHLFRKQHPQIEIRIDASMAMVDFQRSDIDLGIRYGLGNYPGLHVERIVFCDHVFPVCCPELLKGPHPLLTPQDLQFHTLLHVTSGTGVPSYFDWNMWLRSAGIEGVNSEQGPYFVQTDLALRAAVSGLGVCLASELLAQEELETGRLVKPFCQQFESNFAYYLVCAERNVNDPRVKSFFKWIHGMAEVEKDQSPGCLADLVTDP